MKTPEFAKSKKFWTMVGMVITVILEDNGLLSPPAAKQLQVALGIYLGAVAITDHGKEAAKPQK